MSITERINQIRENVNDVRSLRVLAENSGVTYAWLVKFASGVITNPTVENVAKLEAFFFKGQDAA